MLEDDTLQDPLPLEARLHSHFSVPFLFSREIVPVIYISLSERASFAEKDVAAWGRGARTSFFFNLT